MMDTVINAIINNGVAIGVLIYFIYRDNRFTSELYSSLQKLTDTIKELEERVTKNGNN